MRARTALLFALVAACTAHGPAPSERVDDPPTETAIDEPIDDPIDEPPPPPTTKRYQCLSAEKSFPLPVRPLTGTAGDVNDDGALDVVGVSFTSDQQIVVALGDGRGGFEIGETIVAPARALGATLGDFDGDGKVDLVTANTELGTITFMRGDGAGGFVAAGDTKVRKWVGPGVASDLDGDGHLDLVVPLWSAMRVLLGDGRGSFRRGQTIATGQAPEQALLVDLDGDGRRDLAVPSNDDRRLGLLMRRRGGRFRSERKVVCGWGATEVAAGDFDGDGVVDLAMPNMHSDDVCVFRGTSGGGLGVSARLPVGQTIALDTGDFDGDGRDDIAVATSGMVELHTLGQDGWRELSYADGGHGARELWVDDLDGDRRSDVVVLSSTPSIDVFLGRACGLWREASQPPNESARQHPM